MTTQETSSRATDEPIDAGAAALPTVVYGYDPLCGWCFAFGPAMDDVRRRLDGEIRIEVACGGLVVGDRVRPVAEDRAYLRAGLAQVERATGVRAGAAYLEGLLERGTWVSDSEPVCRALRVALDLTGDHGRTLDLGHALTRALYVDGLEPDDPATLRAVADGVGLDGAALLERWPTEQARRATAEWFERSRAAGVGTYPSLFLRAGDVLVPLTEGAVPADEAVRRIRSAAAALVTR